MRVTTGTVIDGRIEVPGESFSFEAPINIAWSEKNRSPLVRVPAKRGMSTRCEVRVPDPSCNPYLALAAMLAAGLDGVENEIDPGEPVNKNSPSARAPRPPQASIACACTRNFLML